MSRIIKTCFVIVFSIILSLPLYGCWDYVDSKDINYVSGMTIDKANNKYLVTFEVLGASGDGQSLNSTYASTESDSIHSAIRDVINKTGSKLQVSHMKVVIVSEDVAKEGIIPVLDLIERDVEVRNDMWLLIAKSIKASDVLKGVQGGSSPVSYKIAGALGKPSKTGNNVSIEIFKFAQDVDTKGESPLVPIITVDKNKEFDVSGCAVFYKDKMVGELNEYDTQILKMIKEEREKEKYVVSIPLKEEETISIELMDVRKKYNVDLVDGKAVIDVKMDIDVALSEINARNFNCIEKKSREEITKYIELYISEEASALIDKLQSEYGSDVIGLGHLLTRSQDKQLQDIGNKWNDTFKEAKVNIKPHVHIRYTGLTKEPIGVGE